MDERKDDPKLQKDMHKNFFDETAKAIGAGYYLEAIFREYAAIEGRLEVMLGLLGAPCSKFRDDKTRRGIDFSHRVECLKKTYRSGKVPGKTRLDAPFFKKLENWRDKRNRIVHGFYKNELQYRQRSRDNKTLAETGLDLAKALYNEANRLKRLRRSHPEVDLAAADCFSSGCDLGKRIRNEMKG